MGRIRPITRRNTIIFILFIISAISVYYNFSDFHTSFNESPTYMVLVEIDMNTTDSDSEENDVSNEPGLIINTNGCKILETPIFPEYYKSNWDLINSPNCSYEKTKLTTLTNNEIINLSEDYEDSECCLHEITRIDNNDTGYKLSLCEEFTAYADISQKEILLTKCENSLTFDATIPVKFSIEEKLEYWKNVQIKNLPPNILLFGIDTVSRSHAYRSLPKTLKLLEKLDFIDFKGYHSIAPSTLDNFMGLLMGLTTKEVRNTCASNWTSPFDSCPFIWKEFSQQNYITMFIENGRGTFNWGGQSGFQKEPTDYYLHSLFTAIRDLRRKNSPYQINENNLDCTSNESVPQFMIDYTKRFIRKFRDIPFFSLNWLSDPFHDNQYTLGTYDKEIMRFFQFLNSIPGLLDRTFVIFLSDHGDRFSFFQTKSMEGFIERGLPTLFIKFPKIIQSKFPNLKNILKTNTEALTSPFDLHHTFKYILSLITNSNNITDDDDTLTFQPIMADRSTLFVPIDMNRTCEMIHIQPGSCVCDISFEMNPIKNQFYLTQIMRFIKHKLNKLIKSSKYHNICSEWIFGVDTIISSYILKKTNNYTDTIIQFKAYPGGAEFEIKIRIKHTITNFDGIELISNFDRVNPYGNQSYCIKFETDEDKKMKELCMCKSLVKKPYVDLHTFPEENE